jgi:LuxR family maltose regulon positive regulatory protein
MEAFNGSLPDAAQSEPAGSQPRCPIPQLFKSSPPSDGMPIIARDRLDRAILATPNLRLAIVRGPAGIGKTTLLVQWYRLLVESGRSCAWLTLDTFDNDPRRLISYLSAALAHGLAGAQFGAVDGDVPLGGWAELGRLVDQIRGADRPIALFLDDFDALHALECIDLVRELAASVGSDFLTVVASRGIPELGQARFRLCGAALDISSDALRFAPEETREFVRGRFGGLLNQADIDALHASTDGWPAALQLACLSIRSGQDMATLLAQMTASNDDFARYLADNVLDRQPPDIREFLLLTSVPLALNGGLCDVLTGRGDSASLLAELDASGLFLRRIEGVDANPWYRYHAMFRDVLRGELERRQPSRSRQILGVAADWLTARGLIAEAAEHARLSGDPARAASLFETIAMSYVCKGQLDTVILWVESLGQLDLSPYPRLFVAHLWAIAFGRSPDRARILLREFRRRNAAAPAGSYIADSFTCLKFMIAGLSDDLDTIRRDGHRALSAMSRSNVFEYGTLANAVAHSFIASGDFGLAHETLAAARAALDPTEHLFGTIYTYALEGFAYFSELQLERATESLRAGLVCARRHGADCSYGSAVAAGFLAEVLYEANDLAGAEEVIAGHLPIVAESGLPDAIIVTYSTSARLAVLRHSNSEARRLLYEMEAIGLRRQGRAIVDVARWELVRLACVSGNLAEAARIVRELDSAPAQHRGRGQLRSPAEELVKDIASARYSLWCNPGARIAGTLHGLMLSAERKGFLRRHLVLGVLHAIALEGEGQHERAVRQMAQLLRRSVGEGFIRTFIDECAMAAALVRDAERELLESLSRHERARIEPRYRSLLSALDIDRMTDLGPSLVVEADPPLGPLTGREIEILECLERGLTNRELASCLNLSETTVKWHLRNIFSKLGVGNRTEAVFSARGICNSRAS